ncbi:hypothetical protein TRFO_39697 [Tritrichomonas foetus]|uniref:Uncharacterized protein n=1 Tax=Tritrichomonas foetus TaxID=1144522 RepID=A0A1J4J3X2_9EUKA|nr:hypothetical protein TRFO_39697 [Tritrichomonas foetus]|eukprot:OHS94126.1 hypothetical protein TRFO_39697 [Tritrichomonas foetus]
MGNRRSGRRPPAPPPLQHFNGIPLRWLSCPNNGQAIHVESKPNLYFVPMKTPLPELFANSLRLQSPWTPAKCIAKATRLVNVENPHFHAINVAEQHEIIFKDVWESIGVTYSRVPVSKEYNTESLDAFCECVNKVLEECDIENGNNGQSSNPSGENNNESNQQKNQDSSSDKLADSGASSNGGKKVVFLVYCGCGLNRVGFCIAGYLAKFCGISLHDAFKKCDESSPRLIYIQRPIDKLCSLFGIESFHHGPAPEWIRLDEKVGPVGEIPLPLEKYNAIKKVSKKAATPEEKAEVFKLLSEAVNDPKVAEGVFPTFHTTLWNSHSPSLNELRKRPHLITFEPRGIKAFIVVTSDEHVFVIDALCNVTEVKARAKCHAPAVASCILIEEKKRAIFLTTDLLVLGPLKVAYLPLMDRLSYLSHSFTKKLKSEPNEQYALQFVFRPMSHLSNASRLRKDIPNLFAKCEGLSFYDCEGTPGESLFLPISSSVVLQFDYNGNDKAILYARGEKDTLEPVGIYRSPNPKYNGLDGRTNRFEFDNEKHEWNPVAVGHNDPPATTEEVTVMIGFLNTNISYDDIFQELDKIVYT